MKAMRRRGKTLWNRCCRLPSSSSENLLYLQFREFFASKARSETWQAKRASSSEALREGVNFLPHHLLPVLDEDAVHGLPRQAAALEVEDGQRGRSDKRGSGDAVRHEVCVTLT